jgi:4'-phosphopantetheinyl transferase EntD
MALAALRNLLPSFVAAADIIDAGQPVILHPEEARLVESSAPKRRREFALGRRCAHLALQQLGCDHEMIAIGPDRAPTWPRTIVGSITHTSGYAAAIAARDYRVRALGVDAEREGGVCPELWHMVFDNTEIDWLLRHGSDMTLATVMFSAKEAYFKAVYPLNRRWLDFHDVRVDIKNAHFCAIVRASTEQSASDPVVVGRYAVIDDLILTAICVQP